MSQEFSQNIHISGWSLLYLACVFIAIKADGVFNPAPTLTLTQSINLAALIDLEFLFPLRYQTT